MEELYYGDTVGALSTDVKPQEAGMRQLLVAVSKLPSSLHHPPAQFNVSFVAMTLH
jgi:hypothetical protein